VADVGDIHDMLDAVAKQFERSTQDVCVQERAEVPDVRVVVDGGTAGVEPACLSITLEKKYFGLTREGVV
jgi:hypothetical protein